MKLIFMKNQKSSTNVRLNSLFLSLSVFSVTVNASCVSARLSD